MSQENKEVKQEIEETSTSTEKVSSPEVKMEVKQPENVDDVKKAHEQIKNLNIALSQEREESKSTKTKLSELEDQLNESSAVIEKFKQAFSTEEQKEADKETKYMTKEEAEGFWEEKFQEVQRKTEEEKKAGLIKNEIVELEKEYDGAEGKLKYDDQEVLNWQKENNKLYLSPREAFISMKRNEIIDWEVKQRMAGKNNVQNVEKPGASEVTHQPTEFVPTNETETRRAILEAMENAEKEI